MDNPPEMVNAIQPKRALIVEDNEDFGVQLVDAIRQLGPDWEAGLCESGGMALAHIAQPECCLDLLLVDLGLPDMSGIQVIQAARAQSAELPILVISVLADNENVLQAIAAGAQGYLHKGDSLLSVTAAIQKVLDGESPISSSLAGYLFRKLKAGTDDQLATDTLLSKQEMELLQLLSRGFTYSESAQRMGIAYGTIQTLVKRIYRKLEVNSKVMAIKQAQRKGWL
jgi:DNA-binding NarL/FixJ family response regulator